MSSFSADFAKDLSAGFTEQAAATQRDRLAAFLTIALAIFALYTIGRFGIDQIRPPGMVPNDYENFHHALARLNAHEPIYRPNDASPFKYSPTFLLIFGATLGQLEFHRAWVLACAISAFAFAWAARWLWVNGIELGRLSQGKLAALLAAFGVFHWHGYIEHYSYGQGDALILSAFVAAAAFAEHELLSALLLALILITKPQAAILLSYFLMTRRWRVLGWSALLTIGLLLAPALSWGWQSLSAMFGQWGQCLQNQSLEFLTGNLNQSLAATVARLSGKRELVVPLTTAMVGTAAALSALFAAALPELSRLGPRGRAWLVAFTLLLYSLSSPLSWRWNTFLWLPIGVLAASDALLKHSKPTRFLLVAFALNGILLQTTVAHWLGIREIDELSRIGLYTLGNALLFLATTWSMLSKLSSREPFSEDS